MTDDRRELVFVVADTTMQQLLQGFFCRAQFHRSLRCGAFAIDPRQNQDVFVASGQNDPGLYAQPEELVRPHLTTHRRAVIMVDADWQGSPGVDQIRLNNHGSGGPRLGANRAGGNRARARDRSVVLAAG
jgi:hypothetical protein